MRWERKVCVFVLKNEVDFCFFFEGDVLRTFKEPWIEPVVDRTIEIVKQTKELIVFNKRSGYPVVPHAEYQDTALVSMVKVHFPDAIPLHRLGTGTTGCIVFALNNHAAKKHCKLFEQRLVKKVYRLVVSGVPDWDELECVCYIGTVKHKDLDLYAAVDKKEKGKESIEFSCREERKGSCCFGRTH